MALEDAVILGRCFEEYGDVPHCSVRVTKSGASRSRPARWRSASAPTTTPCASTIPALATEAGATAYVDREWSREAIIQRYEWIFTYDVEAAEI